MPGLDLLLLGAGSPNSTSDPLALLGTSKAERKTDELSSDGAKAKRKPNHTSDLEELNFSAILLGSLQSEPQAQTPLAKDSMFEFVQKPTAVEPGQTPVQRSLQIQHSEDLSATNTSDSSSAPGASEFLLFPAMPLSVVRPMPHSQIALGGNPPNTSELSPPFQEDSSNGPAAVQHSLESGGQDGATGAAKTLADGLQPSLAYSPPSDATDAIAGNDPLDSAGKILAQHALQPPSARNQQLFEPLRSVSAQRQTKGEQFAKFQPSMRDGGGQDAVLISAGVDPAGEHGPFEPTLDVQTRGLSFGLESEKPTGLRHDSMLRKGAVKVTPAESVRRSLSENGVSATAQTPATPAELTYLEEHALNDAIVPGTWDELTAVDTTLPVDVVHRNDAIDRIVALRDEAQAASSELQLQLDSPDLGTVWVSVRHMHGNVQATIETSSEAAYDQLMRHLHVLRDTIQQAGVALGDLDLGWRSQHGRHDQGPFSSLETRTIVMASQPTETTVPVSRWRVEQTDKNYQVNVFA